MDTLLGYQQLRQFIIHYKSAYEILGFFLEILDYVCLKNIKLNYGAAQNYMNSSLHPIFVNKPKYTLQSPLVCHFHFTFLRYLFPNDIS